VQYGGSKVYLNDTIGGGKKDKPIKKTAMAPTRTVAKQQVLDAAQAQAQALELFGEGPVVQNLTLADYSRQRAKQARESIGSARAAAAAAAIHKMYIGEEGNSNGSGRD
jgi:hypothetical protein